MFDGCLYYNFNSQGDNLRHRLIALLRCWYSLTYFSCINLSSITSFPVGEFVLERRNSCDVLFYGIPLLQFVEFKQDISTFFCVIGIWKVGNVMHVIWCDNHLNYHVKHAWNLPTKRIIEIETRWIARWGGICMYTGIQRFGVWSAFVIAVCISMLHGTVL